MPLMMDHRELTSSLERMIILGVTGRVLVKYPSSV